jgi:hypothetical protein
MGLMKRTYTDQQTVITAENLNDIQDAIIALEDGLFSVDNDKSGEVITIADASTRGFRRMKIFGKTTQGGTPTLDAPMDLVSAGEDGSITVNVAGENDAQMLTIETPNGLPGIPVTSGGNYTDANGQKWVCDEIDFEKGVYVQRVACETVTLTFGEEDSSGRFRQIAAFKHSYKGGNFPCLCNFAEWRAFSNVHNSCCVANYGLYYRNDNYTLEEINAIIGNIPITIVGELNTPIETPLAEETLAAFSKLRTYKDLTTVSNDASAYMELEYVMDAKKYMESLLISGGIAAARLASVTLRASAWTGADSLYSQVVNIDGITEYSKVDLLPSVEQLAIFHNKNVTFVTENEDAVVTVYAIGDKPTQDYTMQASIAEVYA